MGYGQSYYTLRSIFLDGVPPPKIHMHIRVFDVSQDVPIGDLSSSSPFSKQKDDSTHNPSVEVEIPDTEKEVFDVWLRKLWRAKDQDIGGYLQSGSFVNDEKLRVEIPLALKNWKDAMDAFSFFIPAVGIYVLSKLR